MAGKYLRTWAIFFIYVHFILQQLIWQIYANYTLPETNIAPENGGRKTSRSFWGPAIFSGAIGMPPPSKLHRDESYSQLINPK